MPGADERRRPVPPARAADDERRADRRLGLLAGHPPIFGGRAGASSDERQSAAHGLDRVESQLGHERGGAGTTAAGIHAADVSGANTIRKGANHRLVTPPQSSRSASNCWKRQRAADAPLANVL